MDKNKKKDYNRIESAKEKNNLNNGNKNKKDDDTFYNPNSKKMKYDPKTTKPTKPDFSQQIKDNEENKKKNLPIGLKCKNNENKNSLAELSVKNPNFQVSYKGLNNYGNMCYSNVIMQSMVSIHEFVEMLNSIYDKVEEEKSIFTNKNKENTNISFKYPTLYNLVNTMNFYQLKNTSLASKHVKILTNYFDIRGEQNDAHEFLTFLFEKLNNEILDISNTLAEAEKLKKEVKICEDINNVLTSEDDKKMEIEKENRENNLNDEIEVNFKNEYEMKESDLRKEENTEKTQINIENIEIREKKNDLKSLLEASKKNSLKPVIKANVNKKPENNVSNKHEKSSTLLNYDFKTDSINKINDEGWEEVKKGKSRMKLENQENSFDISMIGKIFQGILKHDLETKGLSISKCLIEPFFVLSLDLADYSLDNCFEKFFSRKKVENISNPSASFHQRAFIEKLPKILIIHVKGFYYDKTSHKVVKITKELDYPLDLKIKKDYFSPSVIHQYKNNQYELISVIIHKGIRASEGHYICFCKDSNNLWWALDDSKIFQVDENSFNHFRPYILFYRRIDC